MAVWKASVEEMSVARSRWGSRAPEEREAGLHLAHSQALALGLDAIVVHLADADGGEGNRGLDLGPRPHAPVVVEVPAVARREVGVVGPGDVKLVVRSTGQSPG
jgi:hypothetical protein